MQKKLHDLRISINKGRSSCAGLETKLKRFDASDRKLRTRTMIQAGGLLSKSGLLDLCQIEDGDDLQNDYEGLDKAALLLGILLDALENIGQSPSSQQLETFRTSGTIALKMAAAKASYGHRKIA